MHARKKTLQALARHVQNSERALLEARMKIAGIGGEVQVAGEVPKPPKIGGIDNEVSSHLKRSIPQNYDYDPRALKPLAEMLWALSVSLGHVMTAHSKFVKLKSATVSPDGMVGGRGYVMAVKDIRKTLHDAAEAISAVSDTIHDEIHAPHWRPRLAELEKSDVESVERLVGEAEKILDDPEGETSDEMSEGLEEAEKKGPRVELGDDEDTGSSSMPDGDDLADQHTNPTNKMASSYTYLRANSSLPVETMSGPRVEHLDRGDVDQTGPFGSYNTEETQLPKDQWSRDEGTGSDYAYESEWDNNLLDKTAAQERIVAAYEKSVATSGIPDANTDSTPTEGYDFGIGYGDGNDAHGQGAGGYGNTDSDGRNVYSPSAELPSDPGGATHDEENSDTTPMVENAVGESSMPKHASAWKVTAATELPNDGEPSVARSDYYDGDKGSNTVNSGSEMPGEPEANYEFDKDVQPGAGYRYERGDQPYIKWDSETHNMRPDPVQQRDDQGPYVKQEG